MQDSFFWSPEELVKCKGFTSICKSKVKAVVTVFQNTWGFSLPFFSNWIVLILEISLVALELWRFLFGGESLDLLARNELFEFSLLFCFTLWIFDFQNLSKQNSQNVPKVFLSGKNAKISLFWRVFENLKLAAKQVTFYPLVEITTTLPLSHKALLHTY